MIVKVCGMRDQSNIDALSELQIDMMGFIFYPKSSRFIAEKVPQTPKNIARVGVFVDSDLQTMLTTASTNSLNILQLHGSESVEICRELRSRGYKIIKAVSVATAEDLENSEKYVGEVDFMLFDTKCSGYGGSGERFDWSLLQNYSATTPFLLSGGIDLNMADDISNIKHPQFAGVDLNSRFEISPAMKDIEKLKKILKKLK